MKLNGYSPFSTPAILMLQQNWKTESTTGQSTTTNLTAQRTARTRNATRANGPSEVLTAKLIRVAGRRAVVLISR